MSKEIARRFGLNERQTEFVSLVVAGVDPTEAYMRVGYETTPVNAQSNAIRLLRQPGVAAAVHLEVGRHLAMDAVLARRVIVKILQDDTVSAKVRADLGVKMLRLAGHVEPRAAVADNGPVKSLSEMSTEELRARAEQLEEEIAARAKPVSGAATVPLDTEALEMME